MADNVQFHTRLREVIDDLGLSPAAAAGLAGIDQGRLGHYLAGRDVPFAKNKRKLIDGLHVPEYIFYVPREAAASEIETARALVEEDLGRRQIRVRPYERHVADPVA